MNPPRRNGGARVSLPVIVAAGLLLAATLLHTNYQLVIVSGESMLPTARPGDWMVVDKQAYRRTEPHRGDIVVARDANGFIIKRIVGLPGEEVEVKRGVLYVNGRPVNEAHLVKAGPLDVGKGKLSSGDFATLGDNRSVPDALAVHPILTRRDIVGKVILCSHKER